MNFRNAFLFAVGSLLCLPHTGCGLFGIGGSCTAAIKPSICFTFLNTRDQKLDTTGVRIFAKVDGGREVLLLEPARSSCVESPFPSSNPQVFSLRITGFKGYESGIERTVRVGHNGCHPITENLRITLP